jgi:hypothetical protein
VAQEHDRNEFLQQSTPKSTQKLKLLKSRTKTSITLGASVLSHRGTSATECTLLGIKSGRSHKVTAKIGRKQNGVGIVHIRSVDHTQASIGQRRRPLARLGATTKMPSKRHTRGRVLSAGHRRQARARAMATGDRRSRLPGTRSDALC